MSISKEEFKEMLKEKGLKVTNQRLLVLEVLADQREDVYKRQILIHVRSMRPMRIWKSMELAGISTVSYTHLDVYKRQSLMKCVSWMS